MKKRLLLLSMGFIVACETHIEKKATEPITDNTELQKIYDADQSERENYDESKLDELIKNDSLRRVRVRQLLDANKVRTAHDYENAAMIFQHGADSVDYKLTITLMKKAIEIDSATNKWLLAAATDRYLLSVGKPQIYGTQFEMIDGRFWTQSNFDSLAITDKERILYSVPTLAEQKEQVRLMNLTKVEELYGIMGWTVDEIITLIKKEGTESSEYNFSSSALNMFGYELLGEHKTKEALQIFKLNIQLNPNEYNVYDSYGEGLLAVGDTTKAIINYKKALELNPDSKNARKVLSEIDK